jgi:hypothetical protein
MADLDEAAAVAAEAILAWCIRATVGLFHQFSLVPHLPKLGSDVLHHRTSTVALFF